VISDLCISEVTTLISTTVRRASTQVTVTEITEYLNSQLSFLCLDNSSRV